METALKELLVARILSGCLRFKNFVIKKPTLEEMYVAQEVYTEYSNQLLEYGSMDEDELQLFLAENELWTSEQEETLKNVTKEIENFKVGLYEAAFKTNERKSIRKYLSRAKEVFIELSSKKQAFNHLTHLGAAAILRTRYLVAMSVYTKSGNKVYDDDNFWDADYLELDEIVNFYIATRISEDKFREIARTDPWRSIWNTRKAENRLFGIPPTEYNEDQRNITIWSSIYDSVFEHPECPDDKTVEDDDLLDGWMIIQKRKRGEALEKNKSDMLIGSDKVRNSDEIFIPADTMEDVKSITNLNDERTNLIRKQRLKHARKLGEVNEADMPDTKAKIQQQLNKLYTSSQRN